MITFPFNKIEEKGVFNENLQTIVMLSGNGSTGKSYYADKYFNTTVAMDDITVQECYNEIKHFPIYISKINELLNSDSKFICLDFSHTGTLVRKNVLTRLNYSNKLYNFIIIQFNTPANTVVNYHEKRVGRKLTQTEVDDIYNTMKCTEDILRCNEFNQYPFESIIIGEHIVE